MAQADLFHLDIGERSAIIWLEVVPGVLWGVLTSCLPSDICLLFPVQLCEQSRSKIHSQGQTLLWTDTAEEGILIKMTLQTWYQNTDIKDVNALPSRSECAAADLVKRSCSPAFKTIGQERTGL